MLIYNRICNYVFHRHYNSLLQSLYQYISVGVVDNENATSYLIAVTVVIFTYVFFKLSKVLVLFSRPPPVPLKSLPLRPALSIQFKPDEIAFTANQRDNHTIAPHSGSIATCTSNDSCDDTDSTIEGIGITTAKPPELPGRIPFDLPDSFAPLLSSSQTEMLLHHLTTDLIHGFHVKAIAQIQNGCHIIPLDKDSSRPQLYVDVCEGGCRVSATADVGSDGFSQAQDLDVSISTTSRSLPMVKYAGLTFDPPVSMKNVAPTLIHIPTLFEDNYVVPRYRRIQIIRYFINMIIAIRNIIENVLSIIEGVLHIHLGKVRITPIYKGRSSVDDTSPEWRLVLAFSGYCQLFGFLPIPFINVILPTFIIPQPHSLLQNLLSKQPLASAKLKRENIAEQKIALAALDMIDTWNCQVKLVATPPAIGIDLTLPGGVSLGMEFMHGRDSGAGKSREGNNDFSAGRPIHSSASISSWTSNENSGNEIPKIHFSSPSSQSGGLPFNANKLVPWKVELSAKGSMAKDKVSFHLLNCSFEHNQINDDPTLIVPAENQINIRGSLAIWKATSLAATANRSNLKPLFNRRSYAHRAALVGSSESPSVAAMLLFPELYKSSYQGNRLLEYDFAFDSADSRIDAITFSVGANHPMLNGGSMVTTIFESIYASGSVTARANATLDPFEKKRKRNILKHLPAVDFTFGVQNGFIPPESNSYMDDGQTRTLPKMDGARLMVQILGGIEQLNNNKEEKSVIETEDSFGEGNIIVESLVKEGIKVITEFGVSSIILDSETSVKEFPELEIFEGTKLRAYTSGKLGGNVNCHLKPQKLAQPVTTIGPNIFNPLEAYEVDFSGSNVSVRIRESTTSLGHRRVIIPTETTFKLRAIESIVDMTMEGKSELEILWDFQGLSPILQVTEVGLEPETVNHDKKEQVALLIAPLRQGRLSLKISEVGGVSIEKAATSREDKEGLYDWKFFNALVSSSPDQQSAERLLDVIHDKRSMNKLLQVMRLINNDVYKALEFIFARVWRLKEIIDQEAVSEPKDIIPGYRMARLISLMLCGDLTEVPTCLHTIRRVVAGNGLDVVTVKELLRKYASFYDDWTPEIDRGVRMLETMFNPTPVAPFYVEDHVTPLTELKEHSSRFQHIPSAAQLYDQINDRPDLPLDRRFSNLVGRISPYLSLRQIGYLLKIRRTNDWQPSDLKRLRYVYSIKKKIMDIAESYGGLSFLPQSFLLSVFLGEATRSSLKSVHLVEKSQIHHIQISSRPSTLVSLRQRRARLQDPTLNQILEENIEDNIVTPAARITSSSNLLLSFPKEPHRSRNHEDNYVNNMDGDKEYELGDCLLGPPDVAILLQAGLTSVMKGSSVVQLNQRMLLDLVASQPRTFAVAVLAEIGTPGGQGSPRQLASALMALLELSQNSFRPEHQLDITALVESWLPGLRVPRRNDYMAGGRWARQSYYEAIFSLAKSILEDAECYMALNSHLQRYRHAVESDPIPRPREEQQVSHEISTDGDRDQLQSKLKEAIYVACHKINCADLKGEKLLPKLLLNEKAAKRNDLYRKTIDAYHEAFNACILVRDIDAQSFTSTWFRTFYQRNYNALMIKSVYDNVIDNVDNVRYWMHCLRRGAKYGAPPRNDDELISNGRLIAFKEFLLDITGGNDDFKNSVKDSNCIFLNPTRSSEQELIDAILDVLIYDRYDREKLRCDPLVRLLISNPEEWNYDFTIVTAMGVITEGKAGIELQATLKRLEKKRGVKFIRADTASGRSFEFNAERIIEAIESTKYFDVPFGLVGYSQGCANVLMAESILYSGTPAQQEYIKRNLACRQLLFSAANGSAHGAASDKKASRLIVMFEEFVKYQQGYFSRAFQTAFLGMITSALDSSQFHKSMGGANGFLHDGCRAFWREVQHLPNVPTCTLRGILEVHTTPEALEMLSNMLTKQSGSALHDSQVHVFDAVGHPVYHQNRNGKILKNCEVGAGAIQRTHHWSPLKEEVEFIRTSRDHDLASFDCAKDRHIIPWVDVNARFGFIKYNTNSVSIPDKDYT